MELKKLLFGGIEHETNFISQCNLAIMESNIIVALDIEDRDTAVKVAREVREYVAFFKIGYPLILNYGLNILDHFSSLGKVIVDLKIADIPEISGGIARRLTQHKATGVIVHGFVGRDVIREVKKESNQVYVVAEMSHPGSLDILSGQSNRIALMAKEEGVEGLVAPATRPERIKVLKEISGLKILSPGVGTQGGDARKAVEYGADYLIVGRSVTMSSDPEQKVKELLAER
jgi:orotidine-5'-phosphate decarboxylase